MRRIHTRLARLEKTGPRPDAGPLYLCFDSEEAYQAALAVAETHGGPLRQRHPFVKVYIGVDDAWV